MENFKLSYEKELEAFVSANAELLRTDSTEKSSDIVQLLKTWCDERGLA